jgi:hypothetical protein
MNTAEENSKKYIVLMLCYASLKYIHKMVDTPFAKIPREERKVMNAAEENSKNIF